MIPEYEERLDNLFSTAFGAKHPAMQDYVKMKVELKRLREKNEDNSLPPSNFTDYPFNSVFKSSEHETIAQNIMLILKRTGDIFRTLKWEEYKVERLTDGNFSEGERAYFEKVRLYCKSSDTAQLFSETWKEK